MPAKSRPPARLFVALSQNKKMNLIIRRGSTRHVATFLWDRSKDKISIGQWLKGKIYDHRIDISPNGKHMIYLATNVRSAKVWTAVSRTPFLKALDFLTWRGTWGGGGLFIDDRSYALNGTNDGKEIRLDSGLSSVSLPETIKKRSKELNFSSLDHCLFHNIYGLRLLRDNWSFVSSAKETGDHLTRFSKPITGNWVLYKCVGKAHRSHKSAECEHHELFNISNESTIKLQDWEWAEICGSIIYWAEKGCLFKARTDRKVGIGTPKLIHDFNEYEFSEHSAPY